MSGRTNTVSKFASVGDPFALARKMLGRDGLKLQDPIVKAQDSVFRNGRNNLEGSLVERAQLAFQQGTLRPKILENVITKIALEAIDNVTEQLQGAYI